MVERQIISHGVRTPRVLAMRTMPGRVDKLNRFFEAHRSGDEYDMSAITHVMACTSHFPGLMLRDGR
jgi:hypothetical protein